MKASRPRRAFPDQSSGSGLMLAAPRPSYITNPHPAKRICFYKSGDPQFRGLRVVINARTFKSFDALLDSLSKKVPLPFGVRNITTPRGLHAIHTLDELEDGKSYICSDSRKVKPVNLALARKKLAPWYNARPGTGRRGAVRAARTFPGGGKRVQEPVAVRTPKKLTAFRNGDPTVRRTVMLQRRATLTFEALLRVLSELMHFPVVKLHSLDGSRVDSLHGLIMCSGMVVAAGKEPFKPGNYHTVKSPTPKWLPTNQRGPRRLKPVLRKKKSMSNASNSRNFSQSSERYFVNQLQNSITESMSDYPSNLTDSVELETGHMLESVAETDADSFPAHGTDEQGSCLPKEDDIEKSFRVNQDGSMTVEMKVRLTLKEEETLHWTTTLTRSSVANRLIGACLMEPEPEFELERESSSPQPDPLEQSNLAVPIDNISRNKHKEDDDDHNPPLLHNGVSNEEGNPEEEARVNSNVGPSPRRAPTPGLGALRKVQSLKTDTAEMIQRGSVQSYSYRAETDMGAVTEQYCMVQQSSTRPVPKPRRLGSMDINYRYNTEPAAFKPDRVPEVLQIENSGEEVRETVLHIYQQQTCQEDFCANTHYRAHGVSVCGVCCSRPATANTAWSIPASNNAESEFGRPSTASETINIWNGDSMSLTSDVTVPSFQTAGERTTSRKSALIKTQNQIFTKSAESNDTCQLSPGSGEDKCHLKGKKASNPKVIKEHLQWMKPPGKRRKASRAESSENRKKVQTFSSAGFLKRIYGRKPRPVKSLKKNLTEREKAELTTGSSEPPHVKHPNTLSSGNNNDSEVIPFQNNMLDVSTNEEGQSRGILRHQKSIHQERQSLMEVDNINESLPLPVFNSSRSVVNEYVEHGQEKSHSQPTLCPYDGTPATKVMNQMEPEGRVSEMSEENCDRIGADAKPGYMEGQMKMQYEYIPLEESLTQNEVKQRIVSFEDKSIQIGPSLEKTTTEQNIVHSDAKKSDTAISIENKGPLLSGNIKHVNKTSPEIPSEDPKGEKPTVISVQNVSPIYNSYSMEKTIITHTEHCETDITAASSSPQYTVSPAGRQTTEDRSLSDSPTAEVAPAPVEQALAETVQEKVLSTVSEEPLLINPSLKKARLVSNLSFERKMSLRRESVERSALSSDASFQTATASTSLYRKTQKQRENVLERPPPFKSILDTASMASSASGSPVSFSSDQRASSSSPSSSDASHTVAAPAEQAKIQSLSCAQGGLLSPKPLMKKVKKLSIRKARCDDSILPNKPPVEETNASSRPSLKNIPLPRTQSLRSASSHRASMDNTSPKTKDAALNSSPSTVSPTSLRKTKFQKRLSPYSQSLEVVSPPIKHRTKKSLLDKDLSLDKGLEPTNQTPEKAVRAQRKSLQNSLSKQSTAGPDPDLTSGSPVVLNPGCENTRCTTDNNDEAEKAKKFLSETQIYTQPPNLVDQPVLEKICYSIKSIRQITQNKRPSCLEKSNSLPDFSGHVATTFGSSSKALLAFLAVMTLKEGLSHLNYCEPYANHVSCAEALKLIDSLREIASIEDSDKVKASLSELQKSTSTQLLQSWRGFQELSEKCKSRSSTSNHSEEEEKSEMCSFEHYSADESGIDELMDELHIPEALKAELAAFPICTQTEDDRHKLDAKTTEKTEISADENGKTNLTRFRGEHDVNGSYFASKSNADVEANVNVKAIVERFRAQESNEKPAYPKQQHFPDHQRAVGTQQSTSKYKEDTSEVEDSTDSEVTKVFNEDQPHVSASRVRVEGRRKVHSPDHVKDIEFRHQVEEEQDSHKKDRPIKSDNQSKHIPYMDLQEPPEECLEEDSRSSGGEYTQSKELQMNSEDSMFSRDEVSSSDETREHTLSTDIYAGEDVSRDRTISHSEMQQKLCLTGEQQEVGQTQMKHVRNYNMSDYKSFSSSEEKEHKIQRYDEFKGGSVNYSSTEITSSQNDEEMARSEEDQLQSQQLSSTGALSNPACPSIEMQSRSLSTPDEEDQPSSEEPKVRHKEIKAIIEEHFSGMEEARGNREKRGDQNELQASPGGQDNTPQEDEVSLEYSEHGAANIGYVDTRICHHIIQSGKMDSLIEDEEEYRIEDLNSVTTQAKDLGEPFSLNGDLDNGKDNAGENEPVKVENEKCSSIEDEPNYGEKDLNSEEEHAGIDGSIGESYVDESYAEESYAEDQEEHTHGKPCREKTTQEAMGQREEVVSQSVAERVCLLEKQVAEAHWKSKTTGGKRLRVLAGSDVPSDAESSISDTHTRPAQQSSLSFSYDSSGIITRQPEGTMVRSIKEMFMAKSPDVQQGDVHGPNTAVLSDPSSEDQSQASNEPSESEEDSSRKSIAKGFVRRTIERLYGKKDASADEAPSERPASAPKQKQKETSGFFSPFHSARSKLMSDLPYFNSTNALDTFSEATRCVAFNAQVGPEDSTLIDKERRLICKSVSDPVGINKSFERPPLDTEICEDTKPNAPYSLFSTNSELEDNSVTTKCTYFSLPHASDSDLGLDDLSTVRKNVVHVESTAEIRGDGEEDEEDDSKTEKNGPLPGFSTRDLKRHDNKVHPMPPPGGQVVVVQPGKDQDVVQRRPEELDVLDILYTYCGEHCPIL